MTPANKLYGIPASLYTGKVRSYLIKQRIPFIELGAGSPYYREKLIPKIGRFIMPVLEADDGTVVQDGADIIDFFEQRARDAGKQTRLPAYPETAVQRAVSYLFELFGGEGMLRPAMHYRWDFDDTNLDFIRNDFIAGLTPPGMGKSAREGMFDFASDRMRRAAIAFGVTAQSIPLIEESYAEFLSLFSKHLRGSPFLLGGRPTIGDYGLIAPLFAHLARDPYPATLMRQRAGEVYRWVERMNSPQQQVVEHESSSEALFANDSIPATLKALMRYVAAEYLPEISAHVAHANQWLDERPDLQAGTNGLDKQSKRGVGMTRFIGMTEFTWRGITIETTNMPYRFYLLQRLQDSVAQASADEQQAITELFEQTGLSEILKLKTRRRVERKNHMEVWGPLRSLETSGK